MSRPLGVRQARVLVLLRQHGTWYPGCGWVYGTDSETDAVLRSLVRCGLARQTGTTSYDYGVYVPVNTDA